MTRRCACRAYLDVEDPADPAEVAAVVVMDQRTTQHRDWWLKQSVIDEKVSTPVRMALRKVA